MAGMPENESYEPVDVVAKTICSIIIVLVNIMIKSITFLLRS